MKYIALATLVMGTSVDRLQQPGTPAPAPQFGTRILFHTGWYCSLVVCTRIRWVLQPLPPSLPGSSAYLQA